MKTPELQDNLVTAHLDALAYGGAAVGSVVEGPSDLISKRIFIPFGAPGDEVLATIDSNSKRFLQGGLREVITPSEVRIVPPCPYFTNCGGCDLQHMTIESQRRFKLDLVRSTLARQFKINPRSGVELAGADLPAYRYRSRIVLHIDQNGDVGFYRQGTGDVVPITSCMLVVEPIDEVIRAVGQLGPALAQIASTITIEMHGAEVHTLFKARAGVSADSFPHEAIKRLISPYQIESESSLFHSEDEFRSLGGFSQVNQQGNEILTRLVLAHAQGPRITELYAGSGNFTIPLAQAGSYVTAVEVSKALVSEGQARAEAAGFSRSIDFTCESAERFTKRGQFDPIVVLDPPRAGALAVVEALNPKSTKTIVYVSCNLPTLGRDLAKLCSTGYEVEQVNVVDMFAQTHHVETVSVISSV